MSGRLYRVCLLGAAAVGILAGPALADEGTSARTNEGVARLEALLEAQQQKIEALEQQVAAAQQADMDAARVEQMKQQIREVLSEQEFRESLMPSTVQAGYDKGFFIKSSDEKFKIKFNALLQFRWTYYNTRSENRYLSPGFRVGGRDRSGFDWNRARFRISGHAYSKDLTYLLELDMSSAGGLDATLLYGWVNYRVIDEFQIQMGAFRVASTRADFGSTASMVFPEYPMMNSVFGLGTGLGVRFWGKLLQGKGEYYLDIVNAISRPTKQTITTVTGDFSTVKATQELKKETWKNYKGWYVDLPFTGERLLKPMQFFDGSNILAVYSESPSGTKNTESDNINESCVPIKVDTSAGSQFRTLINIMDGKIPSIQLVDYDNNGIYNVADKNVNRTPVKTGTPVLITKPYRIVDLTGGGGDRDTLNRMPEQSMRPSWRQLR